MSKSVLVIDTPKSCRECNLKFTDEYSDYCPYKKADVYDYVQNNTKPDWCPLIPLPQKRDSSHYIHRGDAKSMIHAMIIMQDTGYNQCLDDLQKGVTK